MNCPNCNARGWSPSASGDKPIDLCPACRGRGIIDAGWRPPGWAWFLAAFIGIVIVNAVVPEAHGGTLAGSLAADSSVMVALCGLAIAIGAIIAALLSIVRNAPFDPNEPTPDEQRAQAIEEAPPRTGQVVRMADRRSGPGQPDDNRSW